jgi:hypothetical protein
MIYITRAQRRAERRAIVLGIVFLLLLSTSLCFGFMVGRACA